MDIGITPESISVAGILPDDVERLVVESAYGHPALDLVFVITFVDFFGEFVESVPIEIIRLS